MRSKKAKRKVSQTRKPKKTIRKRKSLVEVYKQDILYYKKTV